MTKKKSEIGSIYVLSNAAMPGLLKIGFTQHSDTQTRVLQLSKQTAAPLPFILEFEHLVENPAQYEKLIHARLSHCRVAPDKEFFRVDVDSADKIIRKITTGTEDLDVQKDLQNLVGLYRKYPGLFTIKDKGLVDRLEALLNDETKDEGLVDQLEALLNDKP
jgi:hypothetical protein